LRVQQSPSIDSIPNTFFRAKNPDVSCSQLQSMPRNSTSKQSSKRLQVLSSQLSHRIPTSYITKMAARDPITCHALDTTTGRPAANLSVQLSCLSNPSIIFNCTTNSDGRISNWKNDTEKVSILIEKHCKEEKSGQPAGSSVWQLKFDTGSYYGLDKTFWPFVELTFLVKDGEHFHVPLLLGPYSYTTYRGS